jgi:murein DD-endopeptidase MepM/ murein hydrolase activator NlpD
MNRVRKRRALPLLVVLASFGAGVFVDGWLRTYGPPQPVQADAKSVELPVAPRVAPAPPPVRHQPVDEPKIAAAPPAIARAPSVQPLRVPIDGMSIESMKGGFSERRGSRPHEAADILAPRGTPIRAVQDGTIAKLFVSKQGGNTIYEFGSDGPLCYYYAHLERYADGLHDGQRVSQGEVIGYVGTSGNAPPQTPHLHFGVFELSADRKWWQGHALDPYLVFKEQG